MNKTTRAKILSVIIVLLALVVAAFLYPSMPEKMASHWNFMGEVDGYMSKALGLFLLPILMAVMTLIFFYIPKLDPERKNIEKFEESFDCFIVVMNIFMLYLYLLTIAWNMGKEINMNVAMMPAMGALFFFTGILLGKAKRNYTIGIRLPWTLASDVVWDKTHKVGEKLFKATGIITVLGALFPYYAFWFLFVPLMASLAYLLVFSYLEHKKIEGK